MLTGRDICSYYYLYYKKVFFIVRSLDNIINISLKFKNERRNINSFLYNIIWFIRQQRLDSLFGNEYYNFNYGL